MNLRVDNDPARKQKPLFIAANPEIQTKCKIAFNIFIFHSVSSLTTKQRIEQEDMSYE